MNRRKFLSAAAQSLFATGGLFSLTFSCTKSKKLPNIVFILADDLGYGDLSCYGQKKFKTENLDKMAAEGKRFTDFYAGSTVCAPSRCSLMTGFHTGHARVRGNYESGPHGWGACLELRPQDVTVAELLKPAGYATGAFGKWSLGVAPTTGAPWKKGFDLFFGYLNQGRAHSYYPEYLYKNDQKVELEGNKNGDRAQYSADLITGEVLNFIDQNKEKPFFIYWATTIPHAELLVPEDSLQPYLGKFDEKPYVGDHYASQPTPFAAFAGMVTRMDRDIGRLMQKLQQYGLDDNTMVLFSSDNGPHLEGGHDPLYFDSNEPLRGFKRDLYEGGIRVPMIARWPGHIQAGKTSALPFAFWDVLPTVCDIAGVQVPADIDGISFWPELQGKEQRRHDYLYWEFHENKTTDQALRVGNWKAVRHSPDGEIELYDLQKDVGETENVAARNPDVVEKLRQLFENARTEHEIWKLKS